MIRTLLRPGQTVVSVDENDFQSLSALEATKLEATKGERFPCPVLCTETNRISASYEPERNHIKFPLRVWALRSGACWREKGLAIILSQVFENVYTYGEHAGCGKLARPVQKYAWELWATSRTPKGIKFANLRAG
jgi:hypothetical protein